MILKLLNNLPPIPAELIEKIMARVYEGNDEFDKKYKAVNYAFFNLQNLPDVREWIDENILIPLAHDKWDPKALTIGVHAIKPAILIHKDHERDACINYLIELGGPQVETVFYEDDRETPIERHVLPHHTWHCFRTDVAHGVHGIDADRNRIAITIGIEKEFLSEIFKNFDV